jgi:hypothetical protein
MKTLKLIILTIFTLSIFSCSEDIMDEINKEKNDTESMPAANILPSIIVQSAFESTGTDLAWYATVYCEHSAGTWGQSQEADQRIGQNSASLANNSWNNIYYVMLECKAIIDKTDPATGSEPDNFWARGIAQTLLAYNLAITTDMWGDIPYSEALKGALNVQPKFDTQESVYTAIFALLDDAIVNLGKTTVKFGANDYIYKGDQNKWIKAAYSLKARYAMRLSNKKSDAAATALAAISKGFASAADALVFASFEATATGENPWRQFMADRSHLSVGATLFNLMNDRNDPRMAVYFTKIGGNYAPAPNGTALQTQGGVYSVSLVSEANRIAPLPMMSYHELKFIEAEAKFRAGDATWKDALKAAISASFAYSKATEGTYFADAVEPKLTAGNELKEIMTQKYIAMYEYEAMEAYNDYRRTLIPSMNNPNNLTASFGFVHRFPYALSEVSSNGANVPKIDVFKDKVWWAK